MIRDRSILALLTGEFISRLGSQLTNLALPWFVLVTTGSPTRMSIVFGEDEQLVARANSLVEGTTNLTNFLGPALAGFAIALLGAANVLWLDAGSYALSFLVLASLVRVRAPALDEEGTDPGGLWAGLGYLRRDRLVARASLSSLIFGFLFSILVASFPVLAYQQYDHNPRVAGALAAAFGAGSIVGSLATYQLLSRLPAMRMAAGATIGTAAPLWLLVPHVPLAVSLFALALCGASIPMINAPYLGMLSTRVPRALRSKVLQALITINQFAGPIGFMIAGPLFVHAGLHWTYALVAGLATIATTNFFTAVWNGQGLQEAA